MKKASNGCVTTEGAPWASGVQCPWGPLEDASLCPHLGCNYPRQPLVPSQGSGLPLPTLSLSGNHVGESPGIWTQVDTKGWHLVAPEATGAIDPRDPAASPLGCLSVSPFCGTHSRRSGHACCDLLPLSGEGGSFEPWGWTGFCGTGILIADEESAGRWEPRGSGEPGRSGDPSPLHRWGVPWTSLAPCGASLQESAGADALLCKAALPAPAPPCATVPACVCSVALHGGSPGGWALPGSPPSAGRAGSQGAGLPAPSFLCPSALLGLRASCGTFRGRVAPCLSPCSCRWSVGALWFLKAYWE